MNETCWDTASKKKKEKEKEEGLIETNNPFFLPIL